MENTELITISIVATNTKEQIEILATRKGRQRKIQKPIEPKFNDEGIEIIQEYSEIDNPDTAEMFIKRVYQNMIIDDISKVFTDIALQELNLKKLEIGTTIRDNVIASVVDF